MTRIVPIEFCWTDEGVMRPLDRFRRKCDQQFVVGISYRLVPEAERNMAEHRAYFASLNEAWANLPHELADEMWSVEKLRKTALIKCGYATEKIVICDTEQDANKVALLAESLDEFAITVVSSNVVKIYRARSQSVREMGAEFRASKKSVLDYVASLIGVSAEQLKQEAGRAA